jgi:voltage-gated potassium channel
MTLSLKEAARLNGRIIYLEVLVLVLSLYSLGALTADLLLAPAPETHQLLRRIDDVICAVFLLDFFVHLWLAPSKRAFWRTGWIDLLSSIPEIGWLRGGRLFRVFRIMRALRSFSAVYQHFTAERAKGTFVVVGLMSLIAVLFATIAVFEFEQGAPGANIHSAGDALWWAFATITTIGYGDHFPVTVAGRIVAVVLVVFGLSFFGTFTAYVASFGTLAVAAYGIAARLEYILVPIAFGFGSALTAMVATNLGAHQAARAKRVTWAGAALVWLVTGLIGFAAALRPETWMTLFTADAAVRQTGVDHIKQYVEVAARLGAPVIRVFADTQMRAETWESVSKGATRAQVQDWIAANLREMMLLDTPIIVVVSVLFFALYLFLVDRGWVYVVDAFTWVINKIAGA